jgi:hypothetical protein
MVNIQRDQNKIIFDSLILKIPVIAVNMDMRINLWNLLKICIAIILVTAGSQQRKGQY